MRAHAVFVQRTCVIRNYFLAKTYFCRLPSAVCRLPSAVCRLPSFLIRSFERPKEPKAVGILNPPLKSTPITKFPCPTRLCNSYVCACDMLFLPSAVCRLPSAVCRLNKPPSNYPSLYLLWLLAFPYLHPGW